MGEPLVLVVDDEPNILETLSFVLEMEGFRVATAEDGEQALARVAALHPPVVVLDAMMPRRDGFDVCRTIKADPGLAGVHVVMLTAMGQKADRERALAAGADHFMTKPFDEEELLALLRRLTGQG
ncbi:MAG: Response regulator receiver [Acidobacteria bacterium]|nr:Response regulator receiver [Acidobacteriota bacterium]